MPGSYMDWNHCTNTIPQQGVYEMIPAENDIVEFRGSSALLLSPGFGIVNGYRELE